ADLIGDEQIRGDLLRAGAPSTPPFAFSKWMPGTHREISKPAQTGTAAYWGQQLAAMGVFKQDARSANPLAGRKLAILSLDDGLLDAEALLTARLSAESGAVVLERSEMRRIARERNLSDMLATPGGERQAGSLLGADVL